MSDHEARERYYGGYGGGYVAEALWSPLLRLDRAFRKELEERSLIGEYGHWLRHWVGRSTELSYLGGLSRRFEHGRLWAKREDLCHTGSFCSSLAVGYGLLAGRMGMDRVTGATANGDFGVALAAISRAMEMDAKIFMGRKDYDRRPSSVQKMELLGAEIDVVPSENEGRHVAISEALSHWATHSDEVLYCSSSLGSPYPFPRIIQYFLSVIGYELKGQLERAQVSPDFLITPVGSGGFSMGMFVPFLQADVELLGVEGGGAAGSRRDSASLWSGYPGTFQGTYSYLLQENDGDVVAPSSEATGLATANVGPQHAQLFDANRVKYVAVNDAEALAAAEQLIDSEGIMSSMESAHAVAYATKLMGSLDEDRDLIVGLSGRAGSDGVARHIDEGQT